MSTSIVVPRWERTATEAFQPPVLLAALLIALPWGANPSAASLWWGISAALIVCGIPLAVVLMLVRRGVLTDHHVSVKEHRRPVMAGVLVLVLGYLAAAILLQGPIEIVALLVATFLAGLVIAVVSPWWKISGHGMMMGGTIVALTTSWGVVGLLFVPVGLAVCWSRIRLQDHTGPQVISGFIYGLAFLGSIYAWIVT